MKQALTDFTYKEIETLVVSLNRPAYRAKQLYAWVAAGTPYDAMTDLPAVFRAELEKNYEPITATIIQTLRAKDGSEKYLYLLRDGETVEGVFLPNRYGNTCCRMGCKFCATGGQGFARNLTAGEIAAQVYAAQREISPLSLREVNKITHIVLMGMGEPLDNYDNTLRFLRLITHPKGQNISQRRISLSTCGLVPQIEQLAKEGLGITLSVSLHASNDNLRDTIMPINRKYPIAQLLAACKGYTEQTSRRMSVEYAMLRGVNDSPAHAHELAALLQGMLVHVNLIPANDIGRGYEPSSPEHVRRFAHILLRQKINATVRRSLGQDIDAACGQLRNRTETP
jgi:23S rRNA (adenine2503-C2)-methyltransferase